MSKQKKNLTASIITITQLKRFNCLEILKELIFVHINF